MGPVCVCVRAAANWCSSAKSVLGSGPTDCCLCVRVRLRVRVCVCAGDTLPARSLAGLEALGAPVVHTMNGPGKMNPLYQPDKTEGPNGPPSRGLGAHRTHQ